MNKIPFQDGVRTSPAKVTIDGTDYTVTPAIWDGTTPLTANVLNLLQNNVEDAIQVNTDNIGGEDYDNTATYEVGDIVKYEGQLYICITAVETAEDFDNTKWQETDVLSSAGGNEIAIGTLSDITGRTKIYVEESTKKLKYKDSTTGDFTDISGDEIYIGDEEDAPEDTKLLIETDTMETLGTEVIDTLEGNERNRAPSVNAVKDKIVNVNNNIGILTNLTTTEKSNLVGAINEIDGDLSNVETYSTSEKKIGTWIDGKPLYRKVISQSSKNDVDLSSLNYNYLAIVYTIITIASTPHPYIRNPYYTSGTDYFRTLLTPIGNLIIETSHSSITNWTTVIEYTKTTD